MIVQSTMLIVRDDQGRALPLRRVAKGLVDVSDQVVAELYVMRRMHVARFPLQELEVSRLEEAVVRQRSVLACVVEVLNLLNERNVLLLTQCAHDERRREVRVADAERMAGVVHAVVDRLLRIAQKQVKIIVVGCAVRRGAMNVHEIGRAHV